MTNTDKLISLLEEYPELLDAALSLVIEQLSNPAVHPTDVQTEK